MFFCHKGAMKAFYLRGKAHMEVWNETEAQADFQRVLDLDPGMKKTVKKELSVLNMRMEEKREEDRQKYKGMFSVRAAKQTASGPATPEPLNINRQQSTMEPPERANMEEAMTEIKDPQQTTTEEISPVKPSQEKVIPDKVVSKYTTSENPAEASTKVETSYADYPDKATTRKRITAKEETTDEKARTEETAEQTDHTEAFPNEDDPTQAVEKE